MIIEFLKMRPSYYKTTNSTFLPLIKFSQSNHLEILYGFPRHRKYFLFFLNVNVLTCWITIELCFKEQARFQFMYDVHFFWISMRVIAWHVLHVGFVVWEWAASADSMPAEELILCSKSSWTSHWRMIKWENRERIDHGQLGWKAAACYA